MLTSIQLYKKKLILSLIVIGNLLVVFQPTFAEESKLPEAPIFIDNQPINTKYLMRDNHLMVPALFFKHTGVKVDWNETYRSSVFSFGDTMFALPVGENFANVYNKPSAKWERHPLATKTIEFDKQIFVPLVEVAKKFGMSVKYDRQLAKTFITTNIPAPKNSIQRGNIAKKIVALTFDDGPEDFYTPMILDILKEKHVPATFFVMGKQVEVFPTIMKRIVDEGHGIANHTWKHPSLPRITTSQVIEEVKSTQNVMEKTLGRKPDLFRPPFGAITKSDAIVLNELGMRNIMWTVDTLDWSGQSSSQILEIVQRDITPGGIILQHNFQSEARLLDGTVEALPLIIDDLKEKGYQFVTVQTLLAN
jgi:peptidoglycan-N-acetylglucosamine deacetylase